MVSKNKVGGSSSAKTNGMNNPRLRFSQFWLNAEPNAEEQEYTEFPVISLSGKVLNTNFQFRTHIND
jgi:hypothetical protein